MPQDTQEMEKSTVRPTITKDTEKQLDNKIETYNLAPNPDKFSFEGKLLLLISFIERNHD